MFPFWNISVHPIWTDGISNECVGEFVEFEFKTKICALDGENSFESFRMIVDACDAPSASHEERDESAGVCTMRMAPSGREESVSPVDMTENAALPCES